MSEEFFTEMMKENDKQIEGLLYLMVNNIRLMLADMGSEQRIEFMEKCMEGYCRYCGTNSLPCHCERDE